MKPWRSYLPLRWRIVRHEPRMGREALTYEKAARRDFRRVSYAELLAMIDLDDYLPWVKAIAQSEIKRRESWDAPAAWSARFAAAAVILSLMSLGLAGWNTMRPPRVIVVRVNELSARPLATDPEQTTIPTAAPAIRVAPAGRAARHQN